MSTIPTHLEELQILLDAGRRSMKARPFAAAFETHMQAVSALIGDKATDDFLNADASLTRELLAYQEAPDLAGVGRMGNAFVSYKAAAERIS